MKETITTSRHSTIEFESVISVIHIKPFFIILNKDFFNVAKGFSPIIYGKKHCRIQLTTRKEYFLKKLLFVLANYAGLLFLSVCFEFFVVI